MDMKVSEVGVSDLIGAIQAFADDLQIAKTLDAVSLAASHLLLALDALIAGAGTGPYS